MFAFAYEFFFDTISNLVQLVIGCMFLFSVHFLLTVKKGKVQTVCSNNNISIYISALIGITLPCGTYGAVPVVIGLYMSGTEIFSLIPLLISNFIFNMSIPLLEVNFIWKANAFRILTAVITGVFTGILLRSFKMDGSKILREKPGYNLIICHHDLKGFILLCKNFIDSAGLYLILGVTLHIFFDRYIFYSLLKALYSSSVGLYAINYFMGLDVANFMFAAAGQIINRLMDLTALSAFLWLLKFKSVVILYVYYFLIVITLIIPVFI
jgi:hypothetical protein